MAESVTSTAYGPMVVVALERTLPDQQRVVDDPLAYQMLPLYMRLMVKACSWKPMRQLFVNMTEKNSPGLWNGFPCRKRYIADKTTESLAASIQSVVILGAGLDTLAYRIQQLAALRIYEVDLPENITYKKKQIEAIFGAVPAHVTLIPIDFEKQNLEAALKQAGYAFDEPGLFVWEGVTQYLTEDAIRATFQMLAKAKSGSRLIFTYVLQDFIDGDNTYGLYSLYQRFRVKNKIWHFGLHPHDVGDFIGAYGWKVLEDVGADEFSSRYLQPAGRNEPIIQIERTVFAEKT